MDKPTLFITGAAGGIGRRFAQLVHEQGSHRLALADINYDGLVDGFAHTDHLLLSLNVADSDAWQAALEKTMRHYGRLDHLANIAGVIQPAYTQDTTAAQVDHLIDINVKGVVHGTRLAARLMVDQGSGHIINIASLAGIAPVPGISLYSATKFAVRGYSLAAANELRPHNVDVTCVCPGLVDTPMLDLQLDYDDETAVVFANGRAMTTDEVAAALIDILHKRPLERCLPNGRLAKLTNMFPQITTRIVGFMQKRGRRAAETLRRTRRKES